MINWSKRPIGSGHAAMCAYGQNYGQKKGG